MKSQDFEDIVANWRGRTMSIFAFARLQNFISKKARVDNADDMAVFVDHWEGEKFVEHEKLAGIEDGGARGNGDDAFHHDVAKRALERGGQQATRGQHADQTFVGIDRKKIDHALA